MAKALFLFLQILLCIPALADEPSFDSHSPLRYHVTPATQEEMVSLIACQSSSPTHERTVACLAAAEKGDREAQERLGDIYNKGDGETPNKSEALKWYRRAAEGAPTRQSVDYKLAMLYRKDGTYQGYRAAVRYLRRASGPTSDIALAHIFLEGGPGVKPDYVTAYSFAHAAGQWVGLMKQTDWDEARSLEEEAGAHLTTEQKTIASSFSPLLEPFAPPGDAIP